MEGSEWRKKRLSDVCGRRLRDQKNATGSRLRAPPQSQPRSFGKSGLRSGGEELLTFMKLGPTWYYNPVEPYRSREVDP